MKKIITLLLIVFITDIISAPVGLSVRVQTEAETISVFSSIKIPLPKPFLGFEKEVVAMAYTSSPGDLTFTETEPGWGTIAVDPEFIPLGSTVYFPEIYPGQKFLAVDTGKKIIGWKVDIWVSSKETAKEFGKQKLRVVIQKPS